MPEIEKFVSGVGDRLPARMKKQVEKMIKKLS
jgi:hypothetical protein